ncbi:ATPase, T2SS/T4P/T4SS family, partial [Aquisalimonas sp.]|uniref:ATPase, T2SS/T4P/T4SS family n=1 Tax=Aquisalimonas sp. TaxID=1872621 RepID=UPI0025C460B6
MSRYASLFVSGPEKSTDSSKGDDVAAPYRILIVDDEPNVLRALQRVFRRENYDIVTVQSAEAGLTELQRRTHHVVITDYAMPGMNGAEFLRRIKDEHPDTVRILLTGQADTNAVMAAIREGAVYKFILKPWNEDDLRVTVGLALEQYDLRQRNQHLQAQNRDKARQINQLQKLVVTNRSQLAMVLHKRSLLTEQQVQTLYQHQQSRKEPAIRAILDRGWVAEERIRAVLTDEFMFDRVDLQEFTPDPTVATLLPRSFCEKQRVLPLRQNGQQLMLVMADPLDEGLINDLQFNLGMRIEPVTADVAQILAAIQREFGDTGASIEELESLVSTDPYEGIEILIDDDDDVSLEALLEGSGEPPAVRLVNAIILEAIRLGASDIHIQPRTKHIAVRYRLDGILVDKIQIPLNLIMPLVSRIKVMAELDITERRRPQDGRITVKSPLRIVDLRISTLPTINGEKVVMRVLDRNAAVKTLAALGVNAECEVALRHMAELPQGIILATGPTGSGKTTTLYSMLQHSATPEKNYVTIEDPVEYYLDAAGQVLIRERVGLDFPTVLRATLRQDPDVILVGEIRDLLTAQVAFQAAMTGHVVYSTLHTNSSVATVARLLDLGLKPFVIANGLEGVIAQRLIRRNCEHCKAPQQPDAEEMARLGPVFEGLSGPVYAGKGCHECGNTGYRGRVGLYEVLLPSAEMRHVIASSGSLMEIEKQAEREGLRTLIHDARDKVEAGQTTLAEVLRV